MASGTLAGCSLLDSSDDDADEVQTPTPPAGEDVTEGIDDGYPYESEYETVVDVADRGGDPTGAEPVNDVITENLADDTLFYFPEGEYHVSGLLVVQHHTNVGFVGGDAVLRPDDGAIGTWIVVDDVADLRFEGFTLDNTADQTGVRTSLNVSGGHNLVRNVDVRGFQDIEERTHAFTLQVEGAETLLRMRNVLMTDGAENGTAVFVHPANDPGTLGFEHCRIENWYEQGLYGSAHGGPMFVYGGHYANNGMSQVRVGGGNYETTALVKGVTVRVSDPHPANRKGNIRGIWLKEGDGTVIEDCDVTVTDLSEAGSAGAVVVGPESGRTTIRDTRIQVDDSTFAIAGSQPKEDNFVTPSLERPPEGWAITGENLTITGSATNQVGIWVVDRPDCSFRDVDIEHSGRNRAGIGLLRAPGTEIRNLSCITSDFPVLSYTQGTSDACKLTVADVRNLESDVDSQSQDRIISPLENGNFCLRRDLFDLTPSQPVIGLTGQNREGLLARPVDEEEMDRY